MQMPWSEPWSGCSNKMHESRWLAMNYWSKDWTLGIEELVDLIIAYNFHCFERFKISVHFRVPCFAKLFVWIICDDSECVCGCFINSLTLPSHMKKHAALEITHVRCHKEHLTDIFLISDPLKFVYVPFHMCRRASKSQFKPRLSGFAGHCKQRAKCGLFRLKPCMTRVWNSL